LIPGIEVNFGGAVYTVPPLTLGALEGLQKGLQALSASAGTLEPQHIATVLDATYLALKRNYPEITREAVGELVDFGNMHEVLAAITDVSGIRRKQSGETTPQTGSRQAG
jgi:hypothetical protein